MKITLTVDVDGDTVQVTPLTSDIRLPVVTWVTPLPHQLTPRELDVLKLAATGMQYKQIGAILDISERTVRTHMNNAYAQTGMQNNTMLVTWAWLTGLINENDIRRAWREIAPHLVDD